ncbi:MAG: aspartate aminotransferase family protein [Planctomycetes bacterium]|nr:aspartate aminotransferase family protein [Planctomycetota bacterium]
MKRGLVGYGTRNLRLLSGAGCNVVDDQGNSYLDCTSMHGILPLGHSHPAMLETLQYQASQLASCSASFANPQREALCAELADVCGSGTRFFYCNSGTEAVEAAIKFARAATGRPQIIACSRGFHGRTMGALSATHRPNYRKPFLPLLADVQHVPFADLEKLRDAVSDQTAAILIEPVQGEGGVHPAPAGYLAEVQRLAHEVGALMIADEVQTGFGRCGSMFASHTDGIQPDLMCIAKGMANGFPMGALAVAPKIRDWPAGSHGSTFGGNPLACALARTCLKVLRDEAWPQRVAEFAPKWIRQLQQIDSDQIRQVRGRGYLIGIQLRGDAAAIQVEMQNRGVLCMTAGRNVLRLMPPLIISQAQRDQVTSTLAEILR